MKRPIRTRRAKKARRTGRKAAKRRTARTADANRRKPKPAKKATKKRPARARRRQSAAPQFRVAIVNGGTLVGPGTDIDPDSDTGTKLA